MLCYVMSCHVMLGCFILLCQVMSCHVVLCHVIIWPASRAGKVNQILRCDWLPDRARWSYLARSGLPTVFRKKTVPESQNLYWPSLFSQDGWIIYWRRSFGQCPAILTSHLVYKPYLCYVLVTDCALRYCPSRFWKTTFHQFKVRFNLIVFKWREHFRIVFARNW